MRRTLRQIVMVTALSLRTIPRRLGSSIVIVSGIAGVVVVLLAMLTMAISLGETLDGVGRPDRALVLRKNSSSEGASSVSREAALTIQDAAGIRSSTDGKPLASP